MNIDDSPVNDMCTHQSQTPPRSLGGVQTGGEMWRDKT